MIALKTEKDVKSFILDIVFNLDPNFKSLALLSIANS